METVPEIHIMKIGFRISFGIMTAAVLLAVFLFFRFQIRRTAALLLHLRRGNLLRRPAGANGPSEKRRTPEPAPEGECCQAADSTEKLWPA